MHTRIALPGIFGLVVLSFVAATAFVHWEMSAIDDAADEIADDAAPGIEDLAEARRDLRHLDDDHAVRVDRAVEGYLSRPVLPGDRHDWERVHRAKEKLDAVLRRYERETRAQDPEAADTMHNDVPAAAAELGDAITGALESNAARTRESALRIRNLRSESSHIALGLDIVCTLIALTGAYLVHRIARAERVARECRTKELEDFAGRVAHDILSPLGAITFAFDLLRRSDDEAQRTRVIDRGCSALGRIQRLTEGLLDFARAGGHPADGARADVGRTIADLVAELEPAAHEKHVELTTRLTEPLVAACNPGVLTSLVANLARNALKYLGDKRERRIEIRALHHGKRVRVEVEDTGPGIPPDLARRIFDPYVRAADAKEPGFGLGLATVKRLAEAHGGAVGLHSRVGAGSTFWFELPAA
jgi:signal transduction histidine kinase